MGVEGQSQDWSISLPTLVWSIQENGENLENSLETTHNDRRIVERQVCTKSPQDQSRLVESPNSSKLSQSWTSDEGMVSIPPESNSNPSNPTSISTPLFDTNLNIPIAIYKGVRSCAKHPLANFVSYHRIVETYKAFTSYIN